MANKDNSIHKKQTKKALVQKTTGKNSRHNQSH